MSKWMARQIQIKSSFKYIDSNIENIVNYRGVNSAEFGVWINTQAGEENLEQGISDNIRV